MSAFPDTPVTLLARLAAERTGDSARNWTRFFELYQPVIVSFARHVGIKRDAEDVAQDVFVKLVGVFRQNSYDSTRGSFRAYLAAMIRHEVLNLWQKANVRAADRHVSIDDGDNPIDIAVPSETAAILDAKWCLARREAALGHILTKTALGAKTKALYRAYVLEGRSIGAVATAFGVSNNAVSQAKTRIDRMVAEYEALMGD